MSHREFPAGSYTEAVPDGRERRVDYVVQVLNYRLSPASTVAWESVSVQLIRKEKP